MTIPTTPQRGYFEKVYIDTADSYATPTLVEIPDCEDGEWSISPLNSTLMLKRHRGIQRDVPTGTIIGASFNVTALPEDYLTSRAYYVKLRDAVMTKTPVHLQLNNGDVTTSGVEYLKAWWTVTFTKSSPSQGLVNIAVQLSPADSPDDEPPIFGVTSGS
ncbi:hypothetical protein KOR42_33120 [Thalassoglobus neptunius]|uniref:Uncharacterized protein n=1 Tax=Thalassoglobus neptunius TaxID=1938619 RepID=A0A5C5WNY6_9PLAN|nr:hypothetical protein [Thalassoglobus neptunius]TWT51839.1 hypothetical protein KOR42_33120 [Thalassoglobus neptunius]